MIQRDFENFFKTPETVELVGKYGIPQLNGITVKDLSKFKTDMVEIRYAHKVLEENKPKTMVHFFLDDYLINRVWSRAEENARFLQGFKAVLSPDFSQYVDMPQALRLYNHYRKMWVSAYWQAQGMRVIPVIRWSDKDSFEYCLDGMPKNSLIACSVVGCRRGGFEEEFKYGYERCLEELQPSGILFYGKPFEWMSTENTLIIDPEYQTHYRTELYKKWREKHGKD